MSMKKIAVMNRFLPDSCTEAIKKLAQQYDCQVDFFPNRKSLQPVIGNYEVLFGYGTAELMREAPQLKWFACSFAGMDAFLDDDLWANPDCIITNSSGAYGTTISEHIIMVLLMLLRLYPTFHKAAQQHRWLQPADVPAVRSIHGLRITVVGTGDIGTTFARSAKAMGASLLGVRRSAGKVSDPAFDHVCTIEELDRYLPDTDALVLCVPSTPETQHLLDRRRLALLPSTSLVINVGRGSAIEQDALADALRSGKLAGAALDVMTPEPLPPEHPLWDTPNLILTPHCSGNQTLGYTRELVGQLFLENLERYLTGQPLRNVVDRKRGY